MKKIALIATAALMTTPAFADNVFGTWKTETSDKGAHLEVNIKGCGDKICGVITKVFNSDNQTSKGKTMLKNMSADGDGAYSGGTIWAPDKDKTYKSTMKLKGANSLEVKGCVAFICLGQTWSRIK